MPHFFFGSSLFFGSRSQSSGDCIQDVSFCNQQDLGASWAISPRSLASLPPLSRLSPASLPPLSASNCLSQPQFDPLDLNPVCLRCRHSALERSSPPGSCLNSDGLKGFRPPVSCPCLLPLSLAPVSCPCLKDQAVSSSFSQPTFPLPQAPSFTACARARTRRFSSSRGSAASARSSAIRE